jgi:hypothetical protein
MAPIRALDLTKIEDTTTGGDGMICKSTLIHQYKDRWFLYMMYLTKKNLHPSSLPPLVYQCVMCVTLSRPGTSRNAIQVGKPELHINLLPLCQRRSIQMQFMF